MAVLNMVSESTLGSNEEVKQTTITNDEVVGEESQEQSSTLVEETPDDNESIVDDTTEKTVDEPVVDKQDDDTEVKRVDALRLEEERIRKQISELRAEKRQIKEAKRAEPLIVDKPDDLSDIADSDVAVIEKVLRVKGYVRRDDIQTMTYQEKIDGYKNQWLAKHPEYLPENDPEDKNWDSLNSTVSAYFKAPSNPSEISKVLDLAHTMIKPAGSLPVKNVASTDAAKEKLQSSSKGSGGSGSKSSSINSNKFDPSLSKHMQGFSDDELKEMFS